MVRFAGLFACAAALLSTGTPVHAQADAPRILVKSCYVMNIGLGDLNSTATGIRVAFENQSSETLTSITWRATTPAGTVDLPDTGTFSPHVSIVRAVGRHGPAMHLYAFKRDSTSFEATGPGMCSVIETVTATGQHWRDARISPATLYVPHVPSDDSVPAPGASDRPPREPVGIISCQFNIILGQASGYVRFRNVSAHVIDAITFRGFYGTAGMDFVAKGSYAPGVVVRAANLHRRDLPENAFRSYVSLDAPSSCATVNVHYADGTTWQNPEIGPVPQPFPVDAPYEAVRP
jgi:hypothetical protein